MSVEYVGPFRHYEVVVNGYRVPFLDGRELDGGKITFVLDGRLGHGPFPVEVADQVARMVADAIACAFGYGAHPNADYEADPEFPHTRDDTFASLRATGVHPAVLPNRMMEITSVEAEPEEPSE